MEVPLRVHETHADERDAEIARLLTVIARKHPETVVRETDSETPDDE